MSIWDTLEDFNSSVLEHCIKCFRLIFSSSIGHPLLDFGAVFVLNQSQELGGSSKSCILSAHVYCPGMGGVIVKEDDGILESMIRFYWEQLQVGVYKLEGFRGPSGICGERPVGHFSLHTTRTEMFLQRNFNLWEIFKVFPCLRYHFLRRVS